MLSTIFEDFANDIPWIWLNAQEMKTLVRNQCLTTLRAIIRATFPIIILRETLLGTLMNIKRDDYGFLKKRLRR